MQQNAALVSRDTATVGRETATEEASRQRRVTSKEEDEQEKAEGEEGQREPVSTNGNTDQMARAGRKIEYKKSTARRKPAEKARKAQADTLSSSAGGAAPLASATSAAAAEPGFQIRGLKAVVEPIREKPYDPFGGLEIKHEYYEPQEHIDHPWLDKARTDPMITAGGYDLREYYARTLLEAFAGLGCFIAEEMVARDGGEGGGGRDKDRVGEAK